MSGEIAGIKIPGPSGRPFSAGAESCHFVTDFIHCSWFLLKRISLSFPIMFEEASEVFDNMLKSSFPLTIIVFLPAVLILVSPLPAEAAHEFTVYRMQQYDLQGQNYGTHLPPLSTVEHFHLIWLCLNIIRNAGVMGLNTVCVGGSTTCIYTT